MMAQQGQEVVAGRRFEFGKNWRIFLEHLSEERIARAEESLREMLGVESLKGSRFLDVGSGSGLFSLAAEKLGASVLSFDYDPHSVACTAELKRRYCQNDINWVVEEGSVLDEVYLRSLGEFDVVYSWGVLHHTGDMWRALGNIIPLVRTGGKLFIAVYNDQEGGSRRWLMVKRAYNWFPVWGKGFVLWPACVRLWGMTILRDLFLGNPFRTWLNYKKERGMSPWRDVVDWVGGYPFEVAKPEEIFEFFMRKEFELVKLRTCGGGHGCNEFVFRKNQRTENNAL
jgi:2-polyprenyl-6-hydroxyphenyl methylase/3-demethylubiquinone-9 3-methyltransferase